MFDAHALPVPDLGLACRRCGYPLANLEDHRCPECGRAFTLEEYIPSGSAPLLIAGGESVRATDDVVALLKRYQIPYIEHVGPFEAVLTPLRLTRSQIAPPIGVPRDRYLEAIDLIRRLTLGEPMPEPPGPAADPDAADWPCAHCGETNPAHFGICWQCEQPREHEG
jgi:predicted RNA-binding Zn-ribbon protein involved in translation (DUF1610 family)